MLPAVLADHLTSYRAIGCRPKRSILVKLDCFMLEPSATWRETPMWKQSSLISRLFLKLILVQQINTRSGQPLPAEPTGWSEYRDAMRSNLRLSAEQLRKGALRAGSKRYIWRTSGDGSVCPKCAKNEGKLFSWDEPPIGRHPGETASCSSEWCRCYAEPIC
jgi:hypothetical protein